MLGEVQTALGFIPGEVYCLPIYGYVYVHSQVHLSHLILSGQARIGEDHPPARLQQAALTNWAEKALPQTGRRTRSWGLRTYLFSSLASIVVTIPFLLTVSHWGPTYSELTGLVPGLAFLVSVVTWSIFTLQDGVMTGLRNAISAK